MKKATYTKIAKSAIYNDMSMTLGFRRYTCLPQRTRKAFDMALVIEKKTANIFDFAVKFFESMTESEYSTYLATH